VRVNLPQMNDPGDGRKNDGFTESAMDINSMANVFV
jgi:hypothetical protein